MPAKKTIFQKISDDAVRAKTDRVWRDWFSLLDMFGLKEKGAAKNQPDETHAALTLCCAAPWFGR